MTDPTSLTRRAKMRDNYKLRLLAYPVLVLLVAVWFLKDGYLTYPRNTEIANAYEAWVESGEGTWDDHREEDWPVASAAEKIKAKSDGQIMTQKVCGFTLLPVGLVLLGVYITSLRRWIQFENGRFTTDRGHDFTLEQVKKIDLIRWDAKGIADVVYDIDDVTPGRLRLDDWKYETQPIRDMVDAVKAHLGIEDKKAEAPTAVADAASDSPEDEASDADTDRPA